MNRIGTMISGVLAIGILLFAASQKLPEPTRREENQRPSAKAEEPATQSLPPDPSLIQRTDLLLEGPYGQHYVKLTWNSKWMKIERVSGEAFLNLHSFKLETVVKEEVPMHRLIAKDDDGYVWQLESSREQQNLIEVSKELERLKTIAMKKGTLTLTKDSLTFESEPVPLLGSMKWFRFEQ